MAERERERERESEPERERARRALTALYARGKKGERERERERERARDTAIDRLVYLAPRRTLPLPTLIDNGIPTLGDPSPLRNGLGLKLPCGMVGWFGLGLPPIDSACDHPPSRLERLGP